VAEGSIVEGDVAALFGSPCSLIVGTVDTSVVPDATRGWAFELLADGHHARLLLPTTARTARANLETTGRVAVTATDVPTNVSAQLKGRVTSVEPETDRDRARRTEHTDRFFGVLHEVDGTAMDVLERLRPRECFAIVMTLDECFDQTPGPQAGRARVVNGK
jgi:hypothetical protein